MGASQRSAGKSLKRRTEQVSRFYDHLQNDPRLFAYPDIHDGPDPTPSLLVNMKPHADQEGLNGWLYLQIQQGEIAAGQEKSGYWMLGSGRRQ